MINTCDEGVSIGTPFIKHTKPHPKKTKNGHNYIFYNNSRIYSIFLYNFAISK